MKRSLLIPSLFALSLAGPLADPVTAAADLQALRQIAIQEGGRLKPLDSFARELAKRVQGRSPSPQAGSYGSGQQTWKRNALTW